jgi:hypothetical protein
MLQTRSGGQAIGISTRTHLFGRAWGADMSAPIQLVILRGISVHQALRRLLLQGALRVALVVATTAGVVGFLSLVARASQLPGQTRADAKSPSGACMPSHCRAKSETVLRNEKR